MRRGLLILLCLGCGDGEITTGDGVRVVTLPDGELSDSRTLDAPGSDPPTDAALDPAGDAFRPPPPPPDAQRPPDPDARVRDARPPAPDAARPPAPANCAAGQWTLAANGQQRAVRIDLPAQPRAGAPLVVLLHGNGDTAPNFCAYTQLCQFLPQRGAVVATPQGRQRVIQVGGQQANLSWDAYDVSADNEDLVLFDAIVAEATRRCAVGEVYAWGHSQGGYFAFLAAMSRADRVAGALVGAATDPQPGRPWQPARRGPFYFLIGELDFAIQGARQTAAGLERQGHPVVLNVVPGERHGAYLRGHDAAIWAFLTDP